MGRGVRDAAAHEVGDGQVCRLPRDIPAGHVDGRFGVEMPRQGQVHRALDIQHAARVEAQEEGAIVSIPARMPGHGRAHRYGPTACLRPSP
jgi:hypothetical protein